jgi:site-specific recombinase XerD
VKGPEFARYRSWCLAQGHSLRTVTKSVRYLVHFGEDRGLELGPSVLSEDRVIEWIAKCRESGTHPKTLNNYVRELNLWSRFNKLGWKLSYFRRHAPVLADLLSEEDEDRLRQVRFADPSLNARNRAMLLLSLDQGPRRDEMLQMKLSDLVDTPGGGKGILVRRGKGDKPRLLYISGEVWVAIDTYVRSYRIRSDSSALFTARRGPVSYGMMGKIAKDIGRAAGVLNFSWHRGRHRMIDAMLDRGVPLPAIQEVAGHSKAETTVAYASRRALRTLTEREVRSFQKRRFEPPQPIAPAETRAAAVVNLDASSSGRDAGTGI